MKINKNIKIAIIIAVVIALWLISGVFKFNKEEIRQEAIESKVFAEKISPFAYTPTMEIVGRTEVSQDVDLVAEVSGKIIKINTNQGSTVKVGEVMLELENDYRKDRLVSAEQELEAAKLKLDIAKNLAESAYKARTDLADRQAEYSKALSLYTDAKRDYENSYVRAPIDGFVESKNFNLGDYVKEDSILYKIISKDELLLVGFLSQSQIDHVVLGQTAYGEFSNGKKVEGKVTFVSRKGDEKTKTYRIEVSVDPKTQNVLVSEGLTVVIKIPTEKNMVYEIPHSALVINDDGRLGVRIAASEEDGYVVHFKEVKIVEDSNNSLKVSLSSDDDINLITRGHISVKEGNKVLVSFSDE